MTPKAMVTPDPVVSFDPVAAFLRRPLNEVLGTGLPQLNTPQRTIPKSIPQLHTLASEYAWVSVLDLSTTLLAASDQSSNETSTLKPHERIICTMYRTLALVQTRQLDRALTAIEQLGDLSENNPEYRYESHKKVYDGNKTGCFIPIEMRMLAIDIRMRQGDHDAIIDAYELKDEICSGHGTDSAECNRRLRMMLSALAGYHLKIGQGDAAVDLAFELTGLCGDEDSWYTYGKVLLHVGDFDACEEAFAKGDRRGGDENVAKRHAHKAMLLAARGKVSEAVIEYDEAGQNVSEKDGNVGVMVANNVAICLLHVGRIAEAIDRVETAIRKNPKLALDEGLVYNLATLYDLAYPDSCNEKKRVLHRLAERFSREGFQLETLGLSS